MLVFLVYFIEVDNVFIIFEWILSFGFEISEYKRVSLEVVCEERDVVIEYSKGMIDVRVVVMRDSGEEYIESCFVLRMVRRFFEGNVWYFI